MIATTQSRKKSFSSFAYKEAFRQLGVNDLKRWTIEALVSINDFFGSTKVQAHETLLHGIANRFHLLGIL